MTNNSEEGQGPQRAVVPVMMMMMMMMVEISVVDHVIQDTSCQKFTINIQELKLHRGVIGIIYRT
jgi:hypothetical protein